MFTRGMFVPSLVKMRSHGTDYKGVKYNFLCDFFIYLSNYFSRTNVEKIPWTDFDA